MKVWRVAVVVAALLVAGACAQKVAGPGAILSGTYRLDSLVLHTDAGPAVFPRDATPESFLELHFTGGDQVAGSGLLRFTAWPGHPAPDGAPYVVCLLAYDARACDRAGDLAGWFTVTDGELRLEFQDAHGGGTWLDYSVSHIGYQVGATLRFDEPDLLIVFRRAS